MNPGAHGNVPTFVTPITPTITVVRRPAEWLLLSAAVLHLWEVDGHGRAWWGYGLFFVVIVVGQGVYSLLLPRYGGVQSFLVAGVLGNTALIALWAWTRTLGGVPVGPHRHVEPVGLVDSVTMMLQLLAVVLLVQALTHLRAAGPAPVVASARTS